MALTLDPVLSGVPETNIVDATTAEINTPSSLMLANTRVIYRETTSPFRWYRSNGAQLVELGSGTPGTSGSYVYEGGNLMSVVVNGITWSYTYDGNGNPQTVTAGGVTRTYNYDSNGDIVSVT